MLKAGREVTKRAPIIPSGWRRVEVSTIIRPGNGNII